MPNNSKVIALDFNKSPIEIEIDKLLWRPAAYGILIRDDEILLSKQTNGYDLPGGGVNLGEDPAEAVIREVKEETGIIAYGPKLIDAGTCYFKSRSKNGVYYQAVALYYVCKFKPGKLSAEGLEEYEKVFTEGPVWLKISELDNAQIGAPRDYRDVIRKVQSQ